MNFAWAIIAPIPDPSQTSAIRKIAVFIVRIRNFY
jgi:hypothetical protein